MNTSRAFLSGLIAIALSLLGSGCTLVKVAPMIPEITRSAFRSHSIELGRAYDAIAAKKFDRAEAVLKNLEHDVPPTPLLTSEIAFIRAFSIERQGRITEAIASYRTVMETYPRTPDAYLAEKKVRILTAKLSTPAAL